MKSGARSAWVLLVAAGSVMLPACPALAQNDPAVTPLTTGGNQPEPDFAGPPITPETAQAAWEAQRWREAANAYRELSRQYPDDGEFAFRLAYSLHASGQYRRAIRAHQTAAEFEDYRSTALYNLGCAHAVLGENDEAFEALWNAVDAGFEDLELMETDPDLRSLHDDERWEELLTGRHPGGGGGGPVVGGILRDVEFMLGEWEVLDDRGRRVGSISARPAHDDTAVIREYLGDDGTTGTAMLFYDPVLEAWRQVAIDSRGVVVDQIGEAYRDELEIEGEVHAPRGEAFLRRTVTGMDRRGDLEVVTRESEDDGQTWRTVSVVTHRRIGIVPVPWSLEDQPAGSAPAMEPEPEPEPYRAPRAGTPDKPTTLPRLLSKRA